MRVKVVKETTDDGGGGVPTLDHRELANTADPLARPVPRSRFRQLQHEFRRPIALRSARRRLDSTRGGLLLRDSEARARQSLPLAVTSQRHFSLRLRLLPPLRPHSASSCLLVNNEFLFFRDSIAHREKNNRGKNVP